MVIQIKCANMEIIHNTIEKGPFWWHFWRIFYWSCVFRERGESELQMFGWREVHGVGTHMENTQLAHGAVGSAEGEGFFLIIYLFFAIS